MPNVTTLTRDDNDKLNPKQSPNEFIEASEKAEKSVSEAYEAGQEAVSGWLEEVGPKIKGAYEDAEKGAKQAMKSVNSTIKKYPMGAIAVGFGIGCLTGFLVKAAGQRTTH